MELLLIFAQDTLHGAPRSRRITEGARLSPQHSGTESTGTPPGALAPSVGGDGGNNPCGLVPGNNINVSNVASERCVFRGHVWGCAAQRATVLQPVFLVGQKEANGGGGALDGLQRPIWLREQ